MIKNQLKKKKRKKRKKERKKKKTHWSNEEKGEKNL